MKAKSAWVLGIATASVAFLGIGCASTNNSEYAQRHEYYDPAGLFANNSALAGPSSLYFNPPAFENVGRAGTVETGSGSKW